MYGEMPFPTTPSLFFSLNICKSRYMKTALGNVISVFAIQPLCKGGISSVRLFTGDRGICLSTASIKTRFEWEAFNR